MRDKEQVRQELINAGVGCMIFEVFWLRKIRLFAENLRTTEHILGGVWCFFRKHWGRLIATENADRFSGTERGLRIGWSKVLTIAGSMHWK